MTSRSLVTRFRAYQLGNAGSSFSYFDGSDFTLIEGRLTEVNEITIAAELRICGKTRIDVLHITSWDQDHCSPKQLEKILADYSPSKIECPGYQPHTDAGKDSLKIIKKYREGAVASVPKIVRITPEYISSLGRAEDFGYKNILYHPKMIDPDNSNNNSTVKQFRTGSFNVLSLGDVESSNISSYLRRTRSINSEVDILILAHHGADNGFTTSSFLRAVEPPFAIATADYGNKFEHPKPEIRELLYKHGVKLMTTKTGDVIVRSIKSHFGHYEVINLKAGSEEVSSRHEHVSKKFKKLNMNADSIRNMYAKRSNRP